MEKPDLMCTIVSLVPFALDEEKPGLYPGRFQIAAAKAKLDKDANQTLLPLIPEWLDFIPELLHIVESIHYVEVDVDRSIPISNASHKIAHSIIFDYVQGQLGIKPETEENAGPGLFWKLGKHSLIDIIKKFPDELKFAQQRQTNWFTDMITIADDDWEQTRQHKVITNMQRYAAKYLGLDRAWLINLPDKTTTKKCPSCATVHSTEVIVCPICRCILDIEAHKKLSFATA